MDTLYPLSNYKILEVELIGQVTAGYNVVPFIPRGKKIKIPLPAHTQASETKAMTVIGDSLADLNIHDGDDLVFKTRFHISEITPDKVCVVYIHSTGDLIARKVSFNNDGTVTLKAANAAYSDKTYDDDDIEIRGLAFKCVFNLTLVLNFVMAFF